MFNWIKTNHNKLTITSNFLVVRSSPRLEWFLTPTYVYTIINFSLNVYVGMWGFEDFMKEYKASSKNQSPEAALGWQFVLETTIILSFTAFCFFIFYKCRKYHGEFGD